MDPGQAVRLARRLMAEHGLEGWTVRLDRAKTRAGVCRFGPREIGLSAPLTSLHSEAEVTDTILHEIAHALVGAAHGHDAVWRAQAVRIGCSGDRCVDPSAARVEGKWVGRCARGHEVSRHRRPRRLQSCATCDARFNPAHVLSWTYAGRPAPMHPGYLTELAALRRRVGDWVGRPGAVPAPEGTSAATAAAGAPASVSASASVSAGWGRPVADAAAATRPLDLGDVARILAPGRYHGATGVVEACGSTRYQVRVDDLVLAVPHRLLEPA